jgi:hypothetical protein
MIFHARTRSQVFPQIYCASCTQWQQVVEREQGGLSTPTTVAQFLMEPDVPSGGFVVADRAGQISGSHRPDQLNTAHAATARVIVSANALVH